MKVINDVSKNNFEILHEDIILQQGNINANESFKIKKFLYKKCSKALSIKNKRVYIDTLTVASVKRTIQRFYRKLFSNRLNGYESLLSDEERRLTDVVDYRREVEGVY